MEIIIVFSIKGKRHAKLRSFTNIFTNIKTQTLKFYPETRNLFSNRTVIIFSNKHVGKYT